MISLSRFCDITNSVLFSDITKSILWYYKIDLVILQIDFVISQNNQWYHIIISDITESILWYQKLDLVISKIEGFIIKRHLIKNNVEKVEKKTDKQWMGG